MLLLKPVYMPDTCYVLEVAYWLAFGRVPNFMPFEEHTDMRTLIEVMIAGDGNGLDYYDWGYAESEFGSIGVRDIDYERYLDGEASNASKAGVKWREEFIRRLENDTPNPAFKTTEEDRLKLLAEVKAEHVKELADSQYAHSLDRLMKPTMSRAKAAVFQDLAGGKLKSFGYVETEAFKSFLADSDPRTPCPDTDQCLLRQDIPPEVWTLDDFDWRQSTLETPTVIYTHVQVGTEDMLRLFQTPSGPGIPFAPCEIIAFGDVLAVNNVDAPKMKPKTRGRSERAYTIKTAIQNWYRTTVKSNPAYASEAVGVIELDAIVFAKTYLGEELPRTTVQGYLAPVQRPMPENRAGNSPNMAAE